MSFQTYRLTPTDLLFFKDGRPMAAGEGIGHGARWPLPPLFFDALHAALHRAFPEWQDWEPRNHKGRFRNGRGRRGDQRFGTLRTAGPFPLRNGAWLFPAPLDVRGGATEGGLSALRPISDELALSSDLPAPLKYPLGNLAAPTKDEPLRWWTGEQWMQYLREGSIPASAFKSDQDDFDLYSSEGFVGIGTDPDTGTQDGERIYSAEYLRLREDVSLACAAWLPMNGKRDGLMALFPDDGIILCGGQQRVCHVSREGSKALADALPRSAPVEGNRVKWALLSPAIFPKSPGHPGGWIPSWVCAETGRVLLPREKPPREKGESRPNWRRRVQAEAEKNALEVKLVSACVGKPEVLTGWSDALPVAQGKEQNAFGGGKETRLAVPAGSVYCFEGPDAPRLARLLSWDHGGSHHITSRSGAMGEKGLGIGACGPWEFFPAPKKL